MGGPVKVTIKAPTSLPVGAIFVKSHANRSQLFLLPTVLGTLEPAGKLLRAGHRLGHERCAALPAFFALHRSRILFDRLTSRGLAKQFIQKSLVLSGMSANPGVRFGDLGGSIE
jgi:hypothetical protein